MFSAASVKILINSGSTRERASSISASVTSSDGSVTLSNFSEYSKSAASPRARTFAMISAQTPVTSTVDAARAKISSRETSLLFRI